MRPPRRSRILTGEESRLWGEIAKLITPLRGRARPKPEPGEAKAAPSKPANPTKAETRRPAVVARPASAKPPPAKTAPAKPKAAETPRPVPPVPKPVPKPLAHRPVRLADLAPAPPAAQPRPSRVTTAPKPPGLERRERMGLRRGSLAIDARIDLHGLYQADAHAALVGFLLHARAAGHARVLVVTGKGGDRGSEAAFSERGVLRRSVPHWLRGGELGHFVLGFEEAARHHGGAGALYVRLRRR
ncbi:MAG: Smr/MutS family protein [Methylobacterium sp.]